jgi:hypothetical protein
VRHPIDVNLVSLQAVSARAAGVTLARDHVRCACGHVLDAAPASCPDCGAASTHPHGPYRRRRARWLAFGSGALGGGVLAGFLGFAYLPLVGWAIATLAMALRELPPRPSPTFREAEQELRARVAAASQAVDRLERAASEAKEARADDAHAHATRRLALRAAELRALHEDIAQLALARIANRLDAALAAVQGLRDFHAAAPALALARDAIATLEHARRADPDCATLAVTLDAAHALALEAASVRALLADPGDPAPLSTAARAVLAETADAADLLGARVLAGELDAPRTAVADARAEDEALDLVA